MVDVADSDRLHVLAELQRKAIHLACSVFPLLYVYFPQREQMLWLLGLIALFFLLAEILRFKTETFRRLFRSVFLPLLREPEIDRKITGATWLFISLFLTVLIFERTVAIPAMLMLTLADSLAAVGGKSFGKKALFEKTVFGTVTFFLVAFLILVIFLPAVGLPYLVLIALISAFLEAAPVPVNDNLLVPVGSGLLIWVII